MVLPNFYQTIRKHLGYIQNISGPKVVAIFHFYPDTAVFDIYSMPVKDPFDVTTNVLISPIKHDDKWTGAHIDQTGTFDMIVYDLVNAGVDLIESEWFSRTNIENVRITIDNRIYRVLDKQGHVSLNNQSPYHVLRIAQMKGVVVVEP